MSTCDIILVIPPFDFAMMNSVEGRRTRRGGYYIFYPPLGLCSIAAMAESRGLRAAIFDAQFERGWPDCLIRKIESAKPSLVGVLTTTPSLPVVKSLIGELRRFREETRAAFRIIAGGPHISCDPEIVPELGADYGVVGDGEEAVAMLAALLVRGEGGFENIPGLVWPEDGVLRRNNPPPPAAAGNYPPPSRNLLKRDKYFNPLIPAPTTSVLSARGCPFQCSFCCRSDSMGSYRARPVDAVLDEMRELSGQGYGFVSVVDETFTFDKDRAAAIAEGLMKFGPGFSWSCQTRADTVDAAVLSILRRAGCINISFGVEAGDPAVREGVEKGVADVDFIGAFEMCRKIGISTNAFMMIGNPGEGEAEIMRSIEFALRLDPDYLVFNIATLFPGSRFYDRLLAENKIDRGVWTRYMLGESPLPLLSDRLAKPELVRLLRLGFSRFYLRPQYVLRRLGRVRSPRQIWHLARQAGTIVGDYVFP